MRKPARKKAPKKAGAKGKFNPERCAAIVASVKLGLTLDLAARRAGISPRTLHNWLDKGRKAKTGLHLAFVQALRQASADGAAVMVGVINRAAVGAPQDIPCAKCGELVKLPPRGADWRAAKFALERFHGYTPAEVAKRHPLAEETVEQVSIEGTPIEFLEGQLSEIDKLIKRAQASGSYQAASRLRHQLMDVHSKLVTLRKEGNPDGEDMNEERYLREFAGHVSEWPENYFDVVFKVYEERHRCVVVKSMPGGKASA